VYLVARQAPGGRVAGVTGANPGACLVLVALHALEPGFFLRHSDEVLAHECRQGPSLLGRPDPGTVVQLVIH
jgi:hypothetical protein